MTVLAGAVAEKGYPVAAAVDVDQLAVHGDGVGTHEKIIAAGDLTIELPLFLGSFGTFPVDDLIRAMTDCLHQATFVQGHGAAPGDAGAFGHQFQCFCHSGCAVRAVIALHLALFQPFDDGGGCVFIIKSVFGVIGVPPLCVNVFGKIKM